MYKLNNKIYGCPIEAVSDFLGKKWVAEIIWYIEKEGKNFSDIKRKLNGVSTKMLVQQLRLLQDIGIVKNEKTVSVNNEVSSVYYLTERGVELLPILCNIITWGDKNLK